MACRLQRHGQNPGFQPSKFCRLCKKSVSCTGTKVPRVSLFTAVGNKQLVCFTNSESVVLADVVASLGHKLVKSPHLSSVNCLTCARTLTRIYGTFAKLVSNSNDGIPVQSQSKRLSSSPTGISPSAKRTRGNGSSTSTPAQRALALSDESEKENVSPLGDSLVGVEALADRMETTVNSYLSKDDLLDSMMKVRRLSQAYGSLEKSVL